MSARVLVTDGEQRAALAVTRSLGAAGYAVYVCSPRSRSLAGASRSAGAEAAIASPLARPADFAADIGRLIEQWRIDLLLPITDAALAALVPRRAELPPVTLPVADGPVYARLSDKAGVLATAAALGVAVPAQTTVASAEDASRVPADTLRYPIVLKPSPVLARVNGQWIRPGVAYAGSPDELRARLGAWPVGAYPVLLQQRVVGPGIGVSLLRWDDRTVAVFAHRRLREKPPSGGVSVYCESISPDPRLVAQSEALLRQLDWQGVAMVEYKIDAATGTPYLMEVNPRFWGSLQLAVDSGVDFPALLAAAALGRPLPQQSPYRVGVRSRSWWGDVDHLLTRLRHSPAALALSPGAPSRWAALRDFLTLWRPGDRNEILRWRDPMPFVRETVEWIRGR